MMPIATYQASCPQFSKPEPESSLDRVIIRNLGARARAGTRRPTGSRRLTCNLPLILDIAEVPFSPGVVDDKMYAHKSINIILTKTEERASAPPTPSMQFQTICAQPLTSVQLTISTAHAHGRLSERKEKRCFGSSDIRGGPDIYNRLAMGPVLDMVRTRPRGLSLRRKGTMNKCTYYLVWGSAG